MNSIPKAATPAPPRARRLPGIERASEWIADRANPLLVRHVRQQLRSRDFITTFSIMLIIAVISSLIYAAGSGDSDLTGRSLFTLMAVVLSFAVWVAQPLASYRAMMVERDENTWDLIDLTGMTPFQIVRGVLAASAVQLGLYACAAAPFMVMAYLLRGLDLLTIVLVTGGVMALGWLASAFAVFWASVGRTRAQRSMLGGLFGLGLVVCWLGGWGLLSLLIDGTLVQVFLTDPTGAWLVLGVWVNAWLVAVVMCVTLAASLMTFRAGNRSTALRIVWWLVVFNALLWVIGISLSVGGINDLSQGIALLAVFVTAWACIFGFFATTENFKLSPRQARWQIEGGRWRRYLGWALAPGAARGRACFLALIFFALIMNVIAYVTENKTHRLDSYKEIFAFCLVMASHLMLWVAIIRSVQQRWLGQVLGSPVARRAQVLLGLTSCTLLQVIVSLAISEHVVPINILSPAWCLMYVADEIDKVSADMAVVYTVGIGSLVGLAWIWFGVQMVRGWRISTSRVVARATDHNPRQA